MADDSTKIIGTMKLRTIDGQTTRVIVCSACREVAAEYGEDNQINRLVLEATLQRHVMFRHGGHAYETYNRARNTMEPGVVLSGSRII